MLETKAIRQISACVALLSIASLSAGCASKEDNFEASEDRLRSTGNLSYVGETGRVELGGTVDNGVSAVVNLRHSYTDPVVVAFINTRNGDQSVQVRVRAVTSSSFEVFMQEPDNQGHNPETVSYIVVEKGRHTLDDPRWRGSLRRRRAQLQPELRQHPRRAPQPQQPQQR